MANEQLGFLDSLTKIFHREGEEPGADAPDSGGEDRLLQLGKSFEAAVGELRERVEELSAEPGGTSPRGRGNKRKNHEAERQKRMVDIHLRIRGEIEQMHAQLGTGLKADDLDRIATELEELEPLVAEGRTSYELLHRARFAIAEKLREEAGELAVDRLRALLERASMDWPDPIRHDPGASEEQLERFRQRRLDETREVFLAAGFQRTAQRSMGIVTGWGSDYPDPSSRLWQEAVLEGVAAGIRGQLIHAFLELIRRDRDQLIAAIEDLIGKDVEELHRLLDAGADSIPEANKVVARALQAADGVVPELVWKHVCEQEARARGEWRD